MKEKEAKIFADRLRRVDIWNRSRDLLSDVYTRFVNGEIPEDSLDDYNAHLSSLIGTAGTARELNPEPAAAPEPPPQDNVSVHMDDGVTEFVPPDKVDSDDEEEFEDEEPSDFEDELGDEEQSDEENLNGSAAGHGREQEEFGHWKPPQLSDLSDGVLSSASLSRIQFETFNRKRYYPFKLTSVDHHGNSCAAGIWPHEEPVYVELNEKRNEIFINEKRNGMYRRISTSKKFDAFRKKLQEQYGAEGVQQQLNNMGIASTSKETENSPASSMRVVLYAVEKQDALLPALIIPVQEGGWVSTIPVQLNPAMQQGINGGEIKLWPLSWYCRSHSKNKSESESESKINFQNISYKKSCPQLAKWIKEMGDGQNNEAEGDDEEEEPEVVLDRQRRQSIAPNYAEPGSQITGVDDHEHNRGISDPIKALKEIIANEDKKGYQKKVFEIYSYEILLGVLPELESQCGWRVVEVKGQHQLTKRHIEDDERLSSKDWRIDLKVVLQNDNGKILILFFECDEDAHKDSKYSGKGDMARMQCFTKDETFLQSGQDSDFRLAWIRFNPNLNGGIQKQKNNESHTIHKFPEQRKKDEQALKAIFMHVLQDFGSDFSTAQSLFPILYVCYPDNHQYFDHGNGDDKESHPVPRTNYYTYDQTTTFKFNGIWYDGNHLEVKYIPSDQWLVATERNDTMDSSP